MEYTVTEFRKKTREILNEVDAGKRISIRRYDRLYNLLPTDLKVVKKSGVQVVYKEPPVDEEKWRLHGNFMTGNPDAAPNPFRVKETIEKRQAERSVGLCPNGHAIPEGRSKCMGKGCKYAG
jgi:hypothetical protein